MLLALIITLVGTEKIKKLFPPVVTGPVIICIGLGLAPVGLTSAGLIVTNGVYSPITICISLTTLLVIICCQMFFKGFFKLVPILFGIVAGYLISVIVDFVTGNAGSAAALVNFDVVAKAPFFNIPFVTKNFFTLPKFDLGAIITIAPIAIVTFMEHIGDITTNGAVVGKDFIKDPGLNRTVLGDGVATAFAGLIGAPPNTTYSENTGVLATTKVYNPFVLKIAAVLAIFLGFFGQVGAFLQTIPAPVIGGVSVLLYGMISAIGIRTLAESKLDFTHSRNLIIVALILVAGLGLWDGIPLHIGSVTLNISGLFIAVVLGVLANLVLPKKEDTEE